MRANDKFINLSMSFWANIRTIGESVGYSIRGANNVISPNAVQITLAYRKLNLDSSHLFSGDLIPTELGEVILSYLDHRAQILNNYAVSRLMNKEKAEILFLEVMEKYGLTSFVPMNKQTQEKQKPAYFTAIINSIIKHNLNGLPCDYNPRYLTKFTKSNQPLRTFARRLDGAFPTTNNPIAIWEIKEYYYTTTFGSRVADGVYESLLDGMEIRELEQTENIDVKHYVMVDDYFTWWVKGKSYLCRLVDMLHMGYVDEILFGSEVIERLPVIIQEWVSLYNKEI